MRPFSALAVPLVALVAALLLLRGGGTAPGVGDGAERTRSDRAGATLEVASETPVLRGRPAAAREEAGGEGPADPEAAPEPPSEIPVEVEVLDAETDRPVHVSVLEVRGRAVPGVAGPVGAVLTAPPGYVLWEEPTFSVPISRYARAALARVPLHPEMELFLEVEGPSGEAPGDPRVDAVQLAGRNLPAVQEPSRRGLRVRGVPCLPGETVSVHASGTLRGPQGREGTSSAWVEFRVPEDGTRRADLRLTLPAPADLSETIGIGGGAGGAFRGRGSSRRAPRPVTGSLRLVVLRSDRSAARDAAIAVAGRVARTDAYGVAVLRDLPAGPVTARLVEPGLVPTAVAATVSADATAEAVLREGAGGSLAVRVETEDGRPVGCARLAVTQPSGVAWLDVEDGVQRIDPFTDSRGRRDLRRVESGRVRVDATWASRRGSVEAEVLDGGAADAMIVVR